MKLWVTLLFKNNGGKIMKNYETLQLEIILLNDVEDVITTSPGGLGGGEGETPVLPFG